MLNSMLLAQTKFAFDLLQELPQNVSNVISPISISVSLGMALLGAEGNTATEIQSCIANGESRDNIHEYFSNINNFINNNIDEDGVKMINKIFLNNHFSLTEAYSTGIKEYYNGNFQLIDFSDSQKSATNINEFVAEFTNNEITYLAEPQMFDNKVAMILINAILFEKNWQSPFKVQSTKTEFFSSQHNKTMVFMMERERYYRYYENERYQFLELPFENNLYSMLIILPQKEFELSEILKSIEITEILDLTSKANTRNVCITIPQFSIESSFVLKQSLVNLNVNDAFIPTKANFSKLSTEKTFISNIVHKATIKISENGCKAAATTLTGMQKISGFYSKLPAVTFTANRPFLYLIADQFKNIHIIGTFYN